MITLALLAALTVARAANPAAQSAAQPPPPAQPAAPSAPPEHHAPLVPFPHPLMTEIYYAVATGPAGDASGDGARDTTGDEFVELTNPHDKPIQLNGYVITGKAPAADSKGATQLRFTFPPQELAPGEMVVVFNGHKQTWSGPVGDTARAPAAKNPAFHGAWVYTMNITKANLGFGNKGDCVTLTTPGGEKVHAIRWGEGKAPEGCTLVEEAPLVSGQSVERRSTWGQLEPHPEVDGKRYSPGKFPLYSGAPGPPVLVPRPPAPEKK